MTDRSHTRSNFLGGEWSPAALGRLDLPNYDTTLAVSLNGFPLEEGAWTKRGGTIFVGPTKNGYDGIVRTWYIATGSADVNQLNAVQIELTYGPNATGGSATLQVWQWPYTGNAPVATTAAPYQSLDEVKHVEMIATDIGVYLLSQKTPPYILTYNGSFSFNNAHFEKLDGPYFDPLSGSSQTANSLGSVSGTGPGSITFTITDGAYTFTSTDVGRAIRLFNMPPAWNGGSTYVAGDVVTWQNTSWIALVNIPAGAIPGQVTPIQTGTFTGATTGSQFEYVSPWGLVPQQANWAYGYITAQAGSSATVFLFEGGLRNAFTGLNGNGTVIDTWQLGVYTVGQYPACGCWHEGRLWLGGALPGRIDASMTNGVPISPVPGGAPIGNNGALGPLFSPSDQYGQVTDDSGISEQFNASGTNNPLWMIPEQQGIIMGTPQKEWLIQASNQNDVITPTSIQIHPTTQYGALKTRAIRVGIAIAFLQTFGRRVMELVADVFSGRFIGRHINEYAKHLTPNQYHELAYQEEPVPLIWTRDVTGSLFSCTYRRVSHFGQEDPKFMGWGRHEVRRWGTNDSLVSALSDTAITGGNLQSQSSVVLLTGTGGEQNKFVNCQLELVHPYHEVGQEAWQVWNLDGGVSGTVGGTLTIGEVSNNLVISGIPSNYIGTTVSVFLCGLDFGDYVVNGGGAITIPYASDPDGLGTRSWIIGNYGPIGISNNAFTYWTTPAAITGFTGWLPCVVGFRYTAQVQVSRPASRDASEGRTGAGYGKTQRTHMWGATFAQTSANGLVVSAKMTTAGQNAANLPDTSAATTTVDFPVVFRYPIGTPMPVSTLYSGVFWDTINGDYNFDNQITLTSTRPVPLTVASLTGFLAIEDR